MDGCLFCKIMNGDISSFTVYEDNKVKVILNIYPESLGDLLLIPKKHILDLTEMDDETFMHLNKIIKKMDKLLKEKLKVKGLQVIQNNGICQHIKHYHMHLTPQYLKKNKKLQLEEVLGLLTN